MKKSIDSSKEQTKEAPKGSWIGSTVSSIALALALTFSGCSTPVEKIQKQQERVRKLESERLVTADHYEEIYIQRNVQKDLKKKWASEAIDEEIIYSTNAIEQKDEKLEKLSKKLEKEQKKLHKLEEKYPEAASSRIYERNEIDKWSYIRDEYEKANEEMNKRRKAKK